MNLSQASMQSNRSPKQLRRLIDKGLLPAIRISKRDYYIGISDLEKWLQPPRCRGAMRLH